MSTSAGIRKRRTLSKRMLRQIAIDRDKVAKRDREYHLAIADFEIPDREMGLSGNILDQIPGQYR